MSEELKKKVGDRNVSLSSPVVPHLQLQVVPVPHLQVVPVPHLQVVPHLQEVDLRLQAPPPVRLQEVVLLLPPLK